MKKIMLISFLYFFFSSISYSQSSLPKCKGTDRSNYNNCFGEYTLFGGSKYIGEWKNELPNGQGTMNYSDGGKYTGQFKDGVPHGQGTYIWSYGDTYTGEWKNKKMSGQGTYTFKDGKRKKGIFSDGKLVILQPE
jgi:hypothetical protein